MTVTSSPPLHSAARYRPQHEKTGIDRIMQAVARSRLGGWLFVNVFPALDRRLIRLSHGRLKVAMGQPILLLHTRGARSGEPRTTPLLYTPCGDTFVVVASKAGAEHHPAWYHNLRAHPEDVTVEVAGARMPVRARVADGPERARLWERVNDNYNGYDVYQARAAGRTIPVIVLERVREGCATHR
jgi:deazaflavin-dependent oxidoreductase (nitroreductase family)